MNVMIIDDEARMLDLIELFLSPEGYSCLKYTDAQQALQQLRITDVDLVILDIMMPFISGWEVCQEIRQFSNVPILMLTARKQLEDVVKGLKVGADDYMTKPFEEEELLARLAALLRRAQHYEKNKNDVIQRGEYRLNLAEYTLHYQSSQLVLTQKEFKMLETLMTEPKKIFTREQLFEQVWGLESMTELRTIDSHVRNLRDKLKRHHIAMTDVLLTVWGVGYRWQE
ncbi:response regulator transcription factor [Paenibacillus yanchengensis]|uniref:Response regulator transcription factor n=1 Tax=Paenibacillus yanchengensis TaxID=2035833 RepID=A0ABW4YNQ3_9BACL